jgi:hypothetical protein
MPAPAQQESSDATKLINWLLEEERDLTGIPFSDVLAATSGKKILTLDPATDSLWIDKLSASLDRTLGALNTPSHPIHAVGRINEASRHIEDQLLKELNSIPGWTCSVPKTADGKEQRSGYPDLRLELEDGRVVYLDPKLYARNSRDSSLRTFYYEPKTTTAKVHDDAIHLLVGVAHNSGEGGSIRFEKWDLVDISRIRVRLKAEFQASNRDLYNNTSIVRSASSDSGDGD